MDLEAMIKGIIGKVPGPDGLSASYYKYIEDELLQQRQKWFLFYSWIENT